MTEVVNARGDEVLVCEDCRDRYYEQCEVCGEYHIREDMTFVTLRDGDHAYVCEDCMDSYEVCPHCGTMIERCDNGTCPECGAVIDEKEEDEAV
jgi:rubrerythrin|nr:MAG TPA: Thaumarchaeal output domain 1 [Caudoviricetes sp.]